MYAVSITLAVISTILFVVGTLLPTWQKRERKSIDGLIMGFSCLFGVLYFLSRPELLNKPINAALATTLAIFTCIFLFVGMLHRKLEQRIAQDMYIESREIRLPEDSN